MTPDEVLAARAELAHGVFTTTHARDAGLTADQIKWRQGGGKRWATIYDGVHRFAGTPLSWRGALLAAVWAGGRNAVASHRSAAALWALPGGTEDLVELMCPRWRRARHDSLVVHETKALTPLDVTVVDEIPVTTVARTLLDLGAVRGPATVELALENALRRDLVTIASLKPMLARLGRQGRNGAGVLRRLVDERDPDQAPTESEMETRVLQLFRRNGFPRPVPQHTIRDARGFFVARVDFAIVEWKIALEYESIQEHTGKAALLRDNPRRRRLSAAGWTPIGITIEDVRSGGAALCQDIRAVIRAAS